MSLVWVIWLHLSTQLRVDLSFFYFFLLLLFFFPSLSLFLLSIFYISLKKKEEEENINYGNGTNGTYIP